MHFIYQQQFYLPNCPTISLIYFSALILLAKLSNPTLTYSLIYHCCQMAEFWAAGLKNGPVKLLAA
jgi:hypothetical protein